MLEYIIKALTTGVAFGIQVWQIVAILGILVGYGGYNLARRISSTSSSEGEEDPYPEEELPDGAVVLDTFEDERGREHPQLVELPRPAISTASWGAPQILWRLWKRHKRRRKLAKDGYVQWILVDSTYPVPRYVKPEGEGAGIPEYKHDGNRYLFPKDAMVPSEEQGLWTCVHKRGEIDPINMRDTTEIAIGGDTLEEYLTKRVTTSPPSFWDKLDITAEDALKWGMVALVGVFVVQGVLGGGL